LEQSATKRRRLYNRQHVKEKTGQVLHGLDMSVKGYATPTELIIIKVKASQVILAQIL